MIVGNIIINLLREIIIQVQRILNNNYNSNVIIRNNPTFKAKGDVIKIHGAEFVECGDFGNKYFKSKLESYKIPEVINKIERETRDNLAILKKFESKYFKQYLLELIKYVKGEKHAYKVKEEAYDGKIKIYLNEKDPQCAVSRDMERFLRKKITPFVVEDEEGKQWIISSHMTDYSEAAWGPCGVEIAPLTYLK